MCWLDQIKMWTPRVILIIVVCSMASCGADTGRSSSNPSEASMEIDDSSNEPKILRANGRVKGQNACQSASVRTGSDPEDIEFMARCFGRKSGKVFFTVGRHSLDDLGKSLEIESYTRSPLVRGEGAVSRYGEC